VARISSATPVTEEQLASLEPGERLDAALAGIWAHRPQVAQAVKELSQVLAETGTLGARLVELLRIRVAFHNQCRSCMAVRYTSAIDDGLTEDVVCTLQRPEESDQLSDREKAALRYADLFATNHLAIDESVFEDLRLYFDDGEIVELGIQCGRMVGFGRFAATFALYEDLPERFREPSDVPRTPWGGEVLVRPVP
jgi:alkylhydroperoxidase family enzyme